MSFLTGKNYKIGIYGASHNQVIGLFIEGLPIGGKIPYENLDQNLKRRRPQNLKISTSRVEADEIEVVAGLNTDECYDGTPLVLHIKNENIKAKDYQQYLRPTHADLNAKVKYENHLNLTGGSFFSGRLTSLLVVAGTLFQPVLEKNKIEVYSNIVQVGKVRGKSFAQVPENELRKLKNQGFPVFQESDKGKYIREIESAKSNKDSLGGIVELKITNVPQGLGEPYFRSIESELSRLLFSVPAVKGVEFGLGFLYADKFGHEVVEQIEINKNKEIKYTTNYNGGIIGGLSTGSDINLKVVIKPTPTIGSQQNYYNNKTDEIEKVAFKGRHDPAIISRIAVVLESVVILGIYDLLQDYKGEKC